MGSPGPALSQGYGYGVVLGVGCAFAVFMITLTHIKRFNNEVQTSEMHHTAGRTVKSGLVASAVVSSWTWAATLLQSSDVCYRYGVSGPFWYASGATVQILLFATLAITLKKCAPNAHTFLEAIRARYGAPAHFTFIVFGLLTNVLVSLMLLSGGAATINALTGVHTVAALFLMPIPVVAYTFIGGINATFITDYIHGSVVLIIIMIFSLTAYATSDVLVDAAKAHPVAGNKDGSYLTMTSQGGVTFVINIVGNFGTVFLDNGYYNKAIAAHPVHALPGYIMGGAAWFAIPWLTATTLGLAALALEANPRFPTFPERMTEAEVSAGLALPYAAVALLGKGGAIAMLIMIFLAVTSSFDAELVATSSIFTYDIYRTYVNPAAGGHCLIWISHTCMMLYATSICCVCVSLVQRHLHGLPLPAHGRSHLGRRHPRHAYAAMEPPKPLGGHAVAHPRRHLRHRRLACHGQEDVRRSRRRVHRLQRPHAGRQCLGPAVAPRLRAPLRPHLQLRQVRLAVDAGHQQGRRP